MVHDRYYCAAGLLAIVALNVIQHLYNMELSNHRLNVLGWVYAPHEQANDLWVLFVRSKIKCACQRWGLVEQPPSVLLVVPTFTGTQMMRQYGVIRYLTAEPFVLIAHLSICWRKSWSPIQFNSRAPTLLYSPLAWFRFKAQDEWFVSWYEFAPLWLPLVHRVFVIRGGFQSSLAPIRYHARLFRLLKNSSLNQNQAIFRTYLRSLLSRFKSVDQIV